jgi:hypothetical protein
VTSQEFVTAVVGKFIVPKGWTGWPFGECRTELLQIQTDMAWFPLEIGQMLTIWWTGAADPERCVSRLFWKNTGTLNPS